MEILREAKEMIALPSGRKVPYANVAALEAKVGPVTLESLDKLLDNLARQRGGDEPPRAA